MDPIAFEIGSLTIRWYGIMMASSMLLGAFIAAHLLKKLGYDPAIMWDGLAIIILAGVVGARLVYVLTNLSSYGDDPLRVLYVWEGGLSIHGGLLLGGIASYFHFTSRGVPFLEAFDAMVVGVSPGIILVRIGNFMNGDILGYKWEGPWAMNFPHDLLHIGKPEGEIILRHPTEIYGMLVGVVCVIATYLVWRGIYEGKKSLAMGTAFFSFFIVYSLARGIIEDPFRDVPLPWQIVDPATAGFGLFTTSQIASFAIILVCLLCITQLRKWEPKIRANAAAVGRPSDGSGSSSSESRQVRRAKKRDKKD